MKIALIGYGKMGKAIERIALERGHQIVLTIDVQNLHEFTPENIQKAQVAIEFTNPEQAPDNVRKCLEAGAAVVSGSTGWQDQLPSMIQLCKAKNGSLIWSSNYSIGVNLFMKINRMLARMLHPFPSYDVEMQEIHHIHKLDKPSGTAISLAEAIFKETDRKTHWELEKASGPDALKIDVVRLGEEAGTHTVRWHSPIDEITLSHKANNREGLAFGAVLAAEYIYDKKGIFTMEDVLKF